MPLIPKVEMKQAKKIVSARLDEETHSMLQRYALFLGEATHDYIISESLKRLFKRDREFKEWLDKNEFGIPCRAGIETARTHSSEDHGKSCMIQRVLNSKNFLALVLAMVDRHAAVPEDAMAHDRLSSSFDMERILLAIDCGTRSVELRGTQSGLSRHAVHDTIYRILIPSFSSLYFQPSASQ